MSEETDAILEDWGEENEDFRPPENERKRTTKTKIILGIRRLAERDALHSAGQNETTKK